MGTYKPVEILHFIQLFTAVVSISFAIIFYGVIKYSFFKGMAAAFLVMAALEIFIFILNYYIGKGDNYSGYLMIHKISVYTFVLKSIENCALVIGCIIYIKLSVAKNSYWHGLALGLIIQGFLTNLYFCISLLI